MVYFTRIDMYIVTVDSNYKERAMQPHICSSIAKQFKQFCLHCDHDYWISLTKTHVIIMQIKVIELIKVKEGTLFTAANVKL